MTSGLFLAKVLIFCSISSNKCSIRNIENNPHRVSISMCIENRSNQKYPIVNIGVIGMNNKEDYAVYTIDRNCTIL